MMNAIQKIHQKLIAHAGILKSKAILDYGCGRGDMIELLLETPNETQLIVAVDSNETIIKQIENRFSNEILTDRLAARAYSDPKDLSAHSFDVIFCHNVLECVRDKETFVTILFHLLKPDGVLLLSHHDFDSAIYNSDFKELTRKLIHFFADTKQEWQAYHDGQMGRKIPGIFARAGISKVTFETWRIVENSFKPGDYGFLMSEMIMKVCKDYFKTSELNSWKDDLTKKQRTKDYYFAIDVVVAKAVKESNYHEI